MLLEIVKYGNPVLRKKGARIGEIDRKIKSLARDMLETMYNAHGVGLAAQQVGEAVQMAVIDVRNIDRPSTMWVDGREVTADDYMPLILINPEISGMEGKQVGVEGCLSFPQMATNISRAEKIQVRHTNLEGNEFVFECAGLLSRAVQHETDHLNGILFIDRMDPADKAALQDQLLELQKKTKAALK